MSLFALASILKAFTWKTEFICRRLPISVYPRFIGPSIIWRPYSVFSFSSFDQSVQTLIESGLVLTLDFLLSDIFVEYVCFILRCVSVLHQLFPFFCIGFLVCLGF